MRLSILSVAPFSLAAMVSAMADDELGTIELDASLADIEKPPEIPAGVYTGEIQDVQIQTSGKGNRYFAIKFVIPPDELPVDVREHYDDGAVLFWNRTIIPDGKDRRALFNLRKLVEALGLSSNTSSVDPNEWMGRRARLRVKMGKWDGQDRAEIGSIEPAEARAAPKRQETARAPAARAGRGRK